MEQKRNNWDQLQKFFQRNEIYIPPEAIDAVMTCQPDAAVLFVENVHMLLTNRRAYPKIHRTERDLFDASVPHFALPTASDLIRTAAVKPEKADAIVREYKLRMKGVKRAGVSFKDARILKEPKVHVGVPNLPHSASTRMSSASTGTATVANVSSIEIVQRSL
ncbi:hypothetical protein BC830DRAFT_1079462 [Chytriomyces sp. MP71]|nr:hypothetical protein BC830DRAFT_1079462 [Chytriomyces sp. MP71]